MKTKFLHIITVVAAMLFAANVNGQTDSIHDIQGIIDVRAGEQLQSADASGQTNSFHDTQGTIDVSAGGQLQYTLPVALPPGIKSVAPQINLVYTSGAGNGIAGYGWNLSGITAITRMGKTIESDGESRGIQLDNTDYFAYNGQRLLVTSGSNGADGAQYATEKYSNIKIKSVGSVTYAN
jgi:hypothetical protein